MTPRYLSDNDLRRLSDAIHAYNHPGGSIVGQSQSAKTTSAVSLIKVDMAEGRCLNFISPHESACRDLQCHGMTLPRSIRRKVNFISPADGVVMTVDWLAWSTYAELSSAVERFLRIVKAAFGDNIEGDSQPLIDEYASAGIRAVALLRKPPPMAADAIDPNSENYHQIVNDLAQIEPELSAKLAAIEKMQLRERLMVVGPALRRLHTVLRENRYVRDLLSQPATLKPIDLIRKRMITIICLQQTNRHGKKVLRDVDQQLFACLYTVSILDSAYALLHETEKLQVTNWYDELQVFRGAHTEIRKGLAELAKFGVKQFGITQSASNFPDGVDSPLLQSFLANGHFHLNFRCMSEIDSRLFSFLPFLLVYFAKRIKHITTTRRQFIAAHKIVTLINRTYAWAKSTARGLNASTNRALNGSESAGGSLSASRSRSDGQTASNSHRIGNGRSEHQSHPWEDPSKAVSGNSTNESEDRSKSFAKSIVQALSLTLGINFSRSLGWNVGDSEGSSSTETEQTSGSETRSQTIVPVYDWLEEEKIEFYTAQEQQLEMQQRLASLPTGQCLAVVAGQGVGHWVFPFPASVEGFLGDALAERLENFNTELLRRPTYLDPSVLGDGTPKKQIGSPNEPVAHGQFR